MPKQLKPNYEIMKDSIIFSLKNTYNKYIKAINNSLRFTGFDNNGNFFVLEGQEKRNAEVERLNEEIQRLKFKLNEVNNLIKEEKINNEYLHK